MLSTKSNAARGGVLRISNQKLLWKTKASHQESKYNNAKNLKAKKPAREAWLFSQILFQ
jgi:hypothetical protein